MTELDPADLLDLVTEKAPGLRRAGITEIAFGGLSMKLAPHEDESAAATADTSESASGDPMNDRTTFGGVMPGFARLHESMDGDA